MRPLPRYAYLSPQGEQLGVELTQKGVYNLLQSEVFWRNRQQFLEKRGYVLRRRYQQDWKPSWAGTNLAPTYCEDSIVLSNHNVIDATDSRTHERVSIKHTRDNTKEIDIAQFLTSVPDVENHSVPIRDVFRDPHEPHTSLVVMPYLRPFNSPDFEAVGEVVDFVSQTLEGLVFLHRHRIAHRDIAPPNVMMDGRALYPQGHHPVRLKFSEDAVYELTPLPRIENPVRYYFIDFGISMRFEEGAPPHALGIEGRDKDAPEMSFNVPYDAYKVDVYALGNLYFKEFLEMYYGLEFLHPLVDAMKKTDPARRLSAREAMTMFQDIQIGLTSTHLRWRLRSRTESTPERVVYDTVAAAREGLYHLKRLVQ